MATILKRDKEVLEEEQAKEEKSSQEIEKRVEYIQILKKDPLFQKFVIAEIFDKELDALTDIRHLPVDGPPEKVVGLIATAKAARAKLEVIRARLVP